MDPAPTPHVRQEESLGIKHASGSHRSHARRRQRAKDVAHRVDGEVDSAQHWRPA
jgi:hypothetical protein